MQKANGIIMCPEIFDDVLAYANSVCTVLVVVEVAAIVARMQLFSVYIHHGRRDVRVQCTQ